MGAKETAQKMFSLLSKNPAGVHRTTLMRKCGITSESTLFRALRTARTFAKINCSQERYILDGMIDGDECVPLLPTDDELIALVSLQKIVLSMTSGTLGELLEPLQRRFGACLDERLSRSAAWADRVKILDIHNRIIADGVFGLILQAVIRQQVVQFNYTDAVGNVTERVVSACQLVRYKDNWYLDAWCHAHEELRVFSLDGIGAVLRVNKKHHLPSRNQLQQIYATSFGLFTGKPQATATIRFTGIAARYVKRETWHPQQRIEQEGPEALLLHVPYSKSFELVRAVLAWGSSAEVVAPDSLRKEVAAELQKAVVCYCS